MTAILGISAFYHDSAAALLIDGKVVAAAQEERFTRKKHDENFPANAIEYCLREAGISAADLDYVGYYEKPFLKFERIVEAFLFSAPAGFRSFMQAIPLWLNNKLYTSKHIREGLQSKYGKRLVYLSHHESHAASAFFPSPFEKAAILTVDGVGEWATASFGVGQGNAIKQMGEMQFPHSLGLLYSAFTYYCGFKVNSGEYKLMGLAPYGEPVYYNKIMELIDLKKDGSFRMDLSYFDFVVGDRMTSEKFHAQFGGPPRQPETRLTKKEMDIASSIQKVTEEILLRMAAHVHRVTGMTNLCLAGGVALNCVANGRILREGPFKEIWIQPASGDAGGGLGVAYFIWHQLLGNERKVSETDSQNGSLLGPKFDNDSIKQYLEDVGATFEFIPDDEALCNRVADLLVQENVVGWFQGRMEFGPRALGSRSILGDARSKKMQSVMNLKIKFRETFRPFAPSVLQEKVSEYFDVPPDVHSPYMLLVAEVNAKRRTNESYGDLSGIDRLKVCRSEVPAITHVDYSARIQTVDSVRHGRYYNLIKAFERRTECPVIVNTSFNIRGEPIVGTPQDAYRCFLATDMDVLVIENYVLIRTKQKQIDPSFKEKYLAQFKLD